MEDDFIAGFDASQKEVSRLMTENKKLRALLKEKQDYIDDIVPLIFTAEVDPYSVKPV
jgi:cell shape-determining protein MreC